MIEGFYTLPVLGIGSRIFAFSASVAVGGVEWTETRLKPDLPVLQTFSVSPQSRESV
jgi:hypothetical protein